MTKRLFSDVVNHEVHSARYQRSYAVLNRLRHFLSGGDSLASKAPLQGGGSGFSVSVTDGELAAWRALVLLSPIMKGKPLHELLRVIHDSPQALAWVRGLDDDGNGTAQPVYEAHDLFDLVGAATLVVASTALEGVEL